MFCPMMGDGTPIPCTTINRNVMVSHYVVAGSKNPLPLGMGSVKRYNQYESMILPMLKYIEDAGGKIAYNTQVTDIQCETSPTRKAARYIAYVQDGVEKHLELTDNDFIFITNGSQGDGSAYGDQTHAPEITIKNGQGPSIELWKKLAAQDDAFGHPDKFFKDIKETSWESWTVDTANKQILSAIEKICHRDPLSGKVVTGGIVTAKDSSWLMSWTINRQGQFVDQPDDHCLIWVYGLNCWDDDGDYVHKPMYKCTGEELCQEWLYHIGIPVDEIDELAKQCNTTPCMMPYVTSFFEPRAYGDRPLVVPVGSVNIAFVGQYAETPRDTVFTTEYSIRTAMEAVYTLCNADRGVPEVWGSVFDVRELIKAGVKMNDGKMIKDWPLPATQKAAIAAAFKLINNTEIFKLLIRLGAAEKKDFAPIVEMPKVKVEVTSRVSELKDSKTAKIGAGVTVASLMAIAALLHKKKS